MFKDLIIRRERRPCYVAGKRAMWHCWTQEQEIVPPSAMVGGHAGGVISSALGIVEFEDGHCATVHPGNIRFADGGGFDAFVWLEIRQSSVSNSGTEGGDTVG